VITPRSHGGHSGKESHGATAKHGDHGGKKTIIRRALFWRDAGLSLSSFVAFFRS
jgi:hypothetical protein